MGDANLKSVKENRKLNVEAIQNCYVDFYANHQTPNYHVIVGKCLVIQ